jgi:hypothetical protein
MRYFLPSDLSSNMLLLLGILLRLLIPMNLNLYNENLKLWNITVIIYGKD